MITMRDGKLEPDRLYMLKNNQITIRNMEQDGLIFTYHDQKSKTLKVGDTHSFDCRLKHHILMCVQCPHAQAEILVFHNGRERERYQNEEEQCTRSEQKLSESESDHYDESMSAGVGALPTKRQFKNKERIKSIEDSQSTYFSKDNYSNTSEHNENIHFISIRGRKGSDPVIKNPPRHSYLKQNFARQIELFINRMNLPNYQLTELEKETLAKKYHLTQHINEYLINQYKFL